MALNLGQYSGYQPGDDPQWEKAFLDVHGYLPWQDPNSGADSMSAFLNQLNARAFGDSYQSMYGQPPSQDAYRANWFGARGIGTQTPAASNPGYIIGGWKPIRF